MEGWIQGCGNFPKIREPRQSFRRQKGDMKQVWYFFLFWCNSPRWARASSFTRFLDHTQRRTAVGRPPLDEWSTRREDLYLTTLKTDRHPCPGGIRTHNLSRRAAADLSLRPRCHWDQPVGIEDPQILGIIELEWLRRSGSRDLCIHGLP